MTDRASLHQRKRGLRNLRAGPAFLTERRVASLLAFLDAGARPVGPAAPLLSVDDEFDDQQVEAFQAALDAAPARFEAAEPAPMLWAEPAPVEADAEVSSEPEALIAELELEPDPPSPCPPTRRTESPASPFRREQIARAAANIGRAAKAVGRMATMAAAPTPGPRPMVAPPAPARPRGPIGSWVEDRVAREKGAIKFLRDKGFAVTRMDEKSPIAVYWISGQRGNASGADVIAFAVERGFEA